MTGVIETLAEVAITAKGAVMASFEGSSELGGKPSKLREFEIWGGGITK